MAHLDAQVSDQDQDIHSTKPAPVVRAGGGIVLGAGVLATLVGIQTLTGFRFTWGIGAFLVLFTILGVVTAASGLSLMRARLWAAYAGLCCSALVCLLGFGWLVLSLANGLFSVFGLMTPLAAVVAVVLSALSIQACKRASEARARLAEQGLELGV